VTYNIIMMNKFHPTGTLGPVSAQFINALKKQGKTTFTLDDATSIYGKDKHKTIKFLSDLIKRSVLSRIKPGVYLILQMGQENTQLNNWPVIAHQLAGDEEYYISHYSAMRLHGMTTHPLFDISITMPKRHRTKKISHITYHFIYSQPKHFWGFKIHWVTKQDKVYVSDIEKTLLDGLERPDLCGGIKEVVRGIWVKQNDIDWEKMAQYSAKFHTKASVKRLGFILEILGLGTSCIPLLIKTIAPKKDYILFDPDGAKEGNFLNRWHIRLNITIEELKASVWE
jgi:predicted transcriptional regulator of viral defense system